MLLALLPYAIDPYQTILLAYGLVMAIAVLGFNLLLGYTGLLSFGHSAYFGVGAYAVIWVNNQLPYAVALEEGSSGQAPAGVSTVAIRRVLEEVG